MNLICVKWIIYYTSPIYITCWARWHRLMYFRQPSSACTSRHRTDHFLHGKSGSPSGTSSTEITSPGSGWQFGGLCVPICGWHLTDRAAMDKKVVRTMTRIGAFLMTSWFVYIGELWAKSRRRRNTVVAQGVWKWRRGVYIAGWREFKKLLHFT